MCFQVHSIFPICYNCPKNCLKINKPQSSYALCFSSLWKRQYVKNKHNVQEILCKQSRESVWGKKVVIFNHRQQCSEFSSICVKRGPGQKLSNLRNPWNLRIFFFGIFKSKFLILAVGQNRKLRKKKTRNNFSEIPKISDFSEFSIRHFFIFFLTFSFFFLNVFQNLYFTFVIAVLHFLL